MVSSQNTIVDFYDKYIAKIPMINQCLYFVGGLLIVKTIFARHNGFIEGFEQEEKFALKTNNDIYDQFYCNLYKVLMNDEYRTIYELAKVIRIGKINKKSNVLDIGSGLGEHLQFLKGGGIPALGIETSKAMITKCGEMNPDVVVKHANAMDSMIFETNQFSHILCFFYTFYYMPDQEAFLRNCNKWLLHNGILAIHIVDPDKFHPIVQTNDIFGANTHKLLKPGLRTTTSVVKFEGFDYNATYIDKDRENTGEVEFEELFTNTATKHIRKNSHKMRMLTIPEYEKMFKLCGYEIQEKVDLAKARYFNQYVYILKKIN
uniref:Methyltransferase type 11 domain-containing protein n=1 Tax=viral metagenome TaxID=1070528 RepID=A0A6C0BXI4_9ZZZZ